MLYLYNPAYFLKLNALFPWVSALTRTFFTPIRVVERKVHRAFESTFFCFYIALRLKQYGAWLLYSIEYS